MSRVVRVALVGVDSSGKTAFFNAIRSLTRDGRAGGVKMSVLSDSHADEHSSGAAPSVPPDKTDWSNRQSLTVALSTESGLNARVKLDDWPGEAFRYETRGQGAFPEIEVVPERRKELAQLDGVIFLVPVPDAGSASDQEGEVARLKRSVDIAGALPPLLGGTDVPVALVLSKADRLLRSEAGVCELKRSRWEGDGPGYLDVLDRLDWPGAVQLRTLETMVNEESVFGQVQIFAASGFGPAIDDTSVSSESPQSDAPTLGPSGELLAWGISQPLGFVADHASESRLIARRAGLKRLVASSVGAIVIIVGFMLWSGSKTEAQQRASVLAQFNELCRKSADPDLRIRGMSGLVQEFRTLSEQHADREFKGDVEGEVATLRQRIRDEIRAASATDRRGLLVEYLGLFPDAADRIDVEAEVADLAAAERRMSFDRWFASVESDATELHIADPRAADLLRVVDAGDSPPPEVEGQREALETLRERLLTMVSAAEFDDDVTRIEVLLSNMKFRAALDEAQRWAALTDDVSRRSFALNRFESLLVAQLERCDSDLGYSPERADALALGLESLLEDRSPIYEFHGEALDDGLRVATRLQSKLFERSAREAYNQIVVRFNDSISRNAAWIEESVESFQARYLNVSELGPRWAARSQRLDELLEVARQAQRSPEDIRVVVEFMRAEKFDDGETVRLWVERNTDSESTVVDKMTIRLTEAERGKDGEVRYGEWSADGHLSPYRIEVAEYDHSGDQAIDLDAVVGLRFTLWDYDPISSNRICDFEVKSGTSFQQLAGSTLKPSDGDGQSRLKLGVYVGGARVPAPGEL